MVGTNVNGKCSECGAWYYDMEIGPDGRFVPTGKISQYTGKPTYKKAGVHQCRGPNYAGNKLDSLHQKVNSTVAVVQDKSHTDHLNIAHLTGSMAIIKEDLQACKHYLEVMVTKQGLFEQANKLIKAPQNVDIGTGKPNQRPNLTQLPEYDKNEQDYADESTVSEEISDTDDVTDDNPSVNQVGADDIA